MAECFPGSVRFPLQCAASGLWGFLPPDVASQTLVIAQEAWAAKAPRDKRQAVDPDVHQLAGDVYNWDGGFCSLIPMRTLADHNCLCHSAAITAWGLQDHDHVLRQAVAETLSDPSQIELYFRDQYKKAQVERDVLDFGKEIERSPEEWAMEWERELALAKDPNMSLTEIHVFALAHIMRRAIIVYCQAHLNDLEGKPLSPVHFGGVYLPLFLGPGCLVSRTPLLLAYHESHFTALVPLRRLGDLALHVPLADRQGNGLPIHYVPRAQHQPGGAAWFALLSEWLDVTQDPTLPCLAVKVMVDTERPASGWTERAVDPYRGLPAVAEQPRLPPPTPPSYLPFRSGLPAPSLAASTLGGTSPLDRWSPTAAASPPPLRTAAAPAGRGLSSPTGAGRSGTTPTPAPTPAPTTAPAPSHAQATFERAWRSHGATAQAARPAGFGRVAADELGFDRTSALRPGHAATSTGHLPPPQPYLGREPALGLYDAPSRLSTLGPLYNGPYRLPDDPYRDRLYRPPTFQPSTSLYTTPLPRTTFHL